MDRAGAERTVDAERLGREATALLRAMPELHEALAVGLCGSVARGTAGSRSDVDVFVVVSDGAASVEDEDRRWYRRVTAALRPLERSVSVIVYSPGAIRAVANWHVLRLATDAVFIHDIEGRIADLFRRVVAKARASGFEERTLDGRPYWAYAGDASKGWKLELGEDE
ncbi:MAG: nucleotidyltransferase domain-containing protein [Myxococcota bacterium]|nr:nucleotidyltransferase domain-containing protein [Myxococcota bacterium]